MSKKARTWAWNYAKRVFNHNVGFYEDTFEDDVDLRRRKASGNEVIRNHDHW